ncbi:hypothetical protein E4U42_002290 [Claviceps africana]|uniref:SSCRP protein n=1 Tax=Claviceps africana TaxID=83212 RepID=A0A8K0NHL9_9HYPO|nr:hypothetical protein E4U42_002290 [Claviceps africana]
MITSRGLAAVLAVTAHGAPQCATNADCLAGYICGPSDYAFSSNTDNVCVDLNTCTNKPDPQFPNEGPKCGDSIFCNVGGYCGQGYYTVNGDRFATQVCVNKETGVQCAEARR